MQRQQHKDDAKMQIVLTAFVAVAVIAFAFGYGSKTRDNVYTATIMQALLTTDNATTFQTADGEQFIAKTKTAIEVGNWYTVLLKDTKCTDSISDDEIIGVSKITNETVKTIRSDNAITVNRLSAGRRPQ